MINAERNYKDTLFRMVFEDKRELLNLYNALNGTSYDNPRTRTNSYDAKYQPIA